MSETKERVMEFHDEPVKPFRRHWVCPQKKCGGEMITTGEGFTTLETNWKHRCDKCGHEDWADRTYPKIIYI